MKTPWQLTIILSTLITKFVECQSALCSRKYTDNDSGTISATSQSSTEFCNYQTSIVSEKQINLTFTETEMETKTNALRNFVLVFDGPDCLSTRIGVVFNNRKGTFFTSGKYMTALFIADSQNQRFMARYNAVDKINATTPQAPWTTNRILENCGREENKSRGTLHFKGNGTQNALCIWRLKVNADERVHLQVNLLKLMFTTSWLRVLDGSTCESVELFNVNGIETNITFEVNSKSNTMVVIYTSATGIFEDEFGASYWGEPVSTTSITEMSTNPQVISNRSGHYSTDVDEFANSIAIRHTVRVLCVIFVHATYYAFWIFIV